jgi:hypothetical protein
VAVTEAWNSRRCASPAELLNGSFEVTFEPDRGTVVKVRLPLVRGKKQSRVTYRECPARSRRTSPRETLHTCTF